MSYRILKTSVLLTAALLFSAGVTARLVPGQTNAEQVKGAKVTGVLLDEKSGQPVKAQPLLLFIVYIGEEAGLPPGQAIFVRGDEYNMPTAKTDRAGRFTFDGVPPAKYTIAFCKDYEEALNKQSHITVRGRIWVFEVKDATDVKLGTILTTANTSNVK
jgi:hypothetical protein